MLGNSLFNQICRTDGRILQQAHNLIKLFSTHKRWRWGWRWWREIIHISIEVLWKGPSRRRHKLCHHNSLTTVNNNIERLHSAEMNESVTSHTATATASYNDSVNIRQGLYGHPYHQRHLGAVLGLAMCQESPSLNCPSIIKSWSQYEM